MFHEEMPSRVCIKGLSVSFSCPKNTFYMIIKQDLEARGTKMSVAESGIVLKINVAFFK